MMGGRRGHCRQGVMGLGVLCCRLGQAPDLWLHGEPLVLGLYCWLCHFPVAQVTHLLHPSWFSRTGDISSGGAQWQPQHVRRGTAWVQKQSYLLMGRSEQIPPLWDEPSALHQPESNSEVSWKRSDKDRNKTREVKHLELASSFLAIA